MATLYRHVTCRTPIALHLPDGTPDVLRSRDWLVRRAAGAGALWRQPTLNSAREARCPDCGQRVAIARRTLAAAQEGDGGDDEAIDLALAIVARKAGLKAHR